MSRAARADRGATLVEFAFVFPVLMLLFAGLIDLGFMVLGSSVGSNAAREGARVGIIHFLDADDPGSDSFDRIEQAVRTKLAGLIRDSDDPLVTVRCLDGDDPATLKPCDDAIDVDHDLLEVVVSWEGIAGTGLLPLDRTRTSSARMVITGGAPSEPGGGGPVVPGVPEVFFSPLTYTTTETDGRSTVTLTLTRTDPTTPASVSVETVAGTAAEGADFLRLVTQVNFAPGESTKTFDVEIVGDDVEEPAEAFSVVLSDPIGFVVRAGGGTATITIIDDDAPPVACPPPVLTDSPIRVGLSGNSGKVHSAVSFTVTLDPGCTSPQVRFTPADGAGSFGSSRPPDGPCTTSCTWTVPKNDAGWTKGTKSMELVAGGITYQFTDVVVVE